MQEDEVIMLLRAINRQLGSLIVITTKMMSKIKKEGE